MPKYILDPSGKIKDLKDLSKDYDIDQVTKVYAERGGSTYVVGDADSFGRSADVDLPSSILRISNSLSGVDNYFAVKNKLDGADRYGLGRHTIRDVLSPAMGNDGFPVGGFKSEHNSSFGADLGFKKYRNFNNYLTKGEIFATEIEMAGAGIDLNSLGIKDLTKYTFVIELLVESIVYMTAIESILKLEEYTSGNLNEVNFGSYGPINYTSIAKYFRKTLNYPFGSRTKDYDLDDRISAYFLGMLLYVNTDPQQTITNKYIDNLLGNKLVFDEKKTITSLDSLAKYFIDNITSLSNLEFKRLLMLVRRLNQKSEWFTNRLYTAKDTDITRENVVEKFVAEFSYYYVKFIIERIHVGLKVLNGRKNKIKNKLNRSGRLKDSIKGNGLNKLTYNQESKTLNIKSVSLKNASGKNKNRSSMSNALLPQAFIMPQSFIRSSIINRKDNSSLFSEDMIDEYVASYFLKTEKHQERLSNDVVRKLEEYYEKEIMPFYFQDLRTNEIIGFHAFIDSITDNFNPNYVSTKGFGRIDDVKHYTDTTRNVNITFTLAAMSEKDHDLMWYQINKIVSMVYPQWSRGFKVDSKTDSKNVGKEYPFTQVPTASPLIRIRLGDVIKSNYTKHSIEKIHGSGNKDFVTEPPPDFILDKGLFTGKYLYKRLDYEDAPIAGDPREILGKNKKVKYLRILDENKLYYDDYYLEHRGIEVLNPEGDKKYVFSYVEAPTIDELYIADGENFYRKDNLINAYPEIDGKDLYERNLKNKRKSFKDYTKAYTDQSDPKVLNNPITAAYESTFGKGLAGFITMLDVNYQDQLWETERDGSKAPKLVKMTINFAPIHDIPPGLDADGAMRAPVYNAGRIVNKLYGNVYDNKKS